MTADRREALLHRAPIKEEDTHEAVACGSHPAGRPTEARSPEEPLRGCGRKAREPGSCPVPLAAVKEAKARRLDRLLQSAREALKDEAG